MNYNEFVKKYKQKTSKMPEAFYLGLYEIYMQGLSDGWTCVMDTELSTEVEKQIEAYYRNR